MKKTFSFGILIIALGLLVASTPVFANTPAMSTTTTARKIAKLEATAVRLQTRANTEIDRRLGALNKLSTKIQDMKKISTTDKNAFVATTKSQINTLNDLKIKIGADTDAATLKTDVQSITKSYRIYALILPQIAIAAAADRLSSTTDLLVALQTKLQARIVTDQTAGKNVSALQTNMTDITAKIADAKLQIQAAVSGVAELKPDNGDATILAANNTALKTARTAIKTGTQDLKTAYKDAQAIRLSLKKIEKATATSTAVTASTTAQ